MLQNYFRIAIRNLRRNKLFSAINIFGLAIGMTCCMLLWMYIRSELLYDRHQQHARELYFLKSKGGSLSGGDLHDLTTISGAYGPALKAEFPEVAQVARLWENVIDSRILLQVKEADQPVRSFYETRGYNVDSTFFDLFTYHFTEGSPATALRDPDAIVLSLPLARKLFGNATALGKTITVGGDTGGGALFRVTGVYRDESHRSHINARFFVPMSAGWVGEFLRSRPLNFSFNNMFVTYLRLRPGADAQKLEGKFPAFMERHANKDLAAAGYTKQLSLLPVTDVHLYDKLDNVVTPTSSSTYLYILGSIALLTLLIACINFMNLSTARSVRRAAEVGVRKVMGADKGSLVRQFLGEAVLLAFAALLMAVCMVLLALPLFNQLTDKTLSAAVLLAPDILGGFVALALLTGLLAGSYPAFYLSVFNPVQVLKGRFVNAMSAVALRRALVVFQFVISIGLVLATLMIREQMQFLRNKPLGFTKDQQIVIPLRTEDAHNAYTPLRNSVLQSHLVAGAAGAMSYPGIFNPQNFSVHKAEETVAEGKHINANWVAPGFMQMMGFRLLQGRMFSEKFMSDTSGRIVVNEAALRELSIPPDKAIGQKLKWELKEQVSETYEIVGVVKDFHFQDLRHPIRPYLFFLSRNDYYNYLVVHVQAARVDEALQFLSRQWQTLCPDEPFEYTFLDQDFQHNYQAEARTSRIVSSFTAIAIFISCLGLLGLAAFAAQQRTREIGIRKVLGASVLNITAMLSKDFIRLVLIAILIASPLAWYCMHRWLDDFAYRVQISGWIFAAAGAFAVITALLTVSTQAVRAALMNPVKSLRSE
ncbi:ABC transporter permease [Chitinophaga japonensis]|uniref:Putative ABC transport system permease protein n=1 Tax=Chitinophaga japonensis TaxID=104662 RepID=A0A562TBH6_CHIJA|nr:ABC transporter permease [Chitinophaga japonensis]TWI90895.1 putative ABC transport system permease protein [Chitinophaga japonensis]